jgi:hypothetical protein
MASAIKSPSDVDVTKIEFMPVKTRDNGSKSVDLRYESRNLMLETPSMRIPYGVNIYDKAGPQALKYSVDLSLGGADENADVAALQGFLESFDERMIDAAVDNAQKWFKMSNPSREVIKAFYTPLVKVPRDAQGNLKPYPPTFKVSLRKKKDGAFETDFYDGTKKPLEAFDRDTPIEQVLPKRSQATTIIACTGVWFAGGKFGTTWKAVQLRVDGVPEQIRGPAFKSDAPDVRAFVSKKGGAAVAPVYEDDDEDEAEEEVVAAVLPPKPTLKSVAKVAPAPPPAVFEEEQVAEPVEVPKAAIKVAKKVVKKA